MSILEEVFSLLCKTHSIIFENIEISLLFIIKLISVINIFIKNMTKRKRSNEFKDMINFDNFGELDQLKKDFSSSKPFNN